MIIFLIEQIQSLDFEGWSYITKDNLLNYRISGYSCAIGNDPNIYARLYIACYDNNQNQVDWTFIGSSSSGSSTNNNRFFNIDSVKVKNSYISRFNRLTNSSFETWLYTPEDNGRTAQLWIKRDTFKYSGNYSLKAFVTTILNPLSEVDSFVVISDGGLIYVDSVNFKIYCYVGNITPIKDREFINLKRGFYFLLIENENRIILKRRLIT